MGDFYSGITDADGKYAVPAPLATKMLKNIEIKSVCIPYTQKYPMTSKTLSINAADDDVDAAVVSAEGGLKATNKGTFKQITLTTKEIAVIVPLTEE
ncbi:MAG: phage major capsid protein, partial [Candidatus Heimdallarchaeaceae archaeon]